MLRLAIHILTAFFATALVSTLSVWLPAWLPAPDVAVVVTLYLGLRQRGSLPFVVLAALLLGYLTDLAAGTPPGLLALSYSVVVLLARLVATTLLFRGIWYVAFFSALAALTTAGLVAGVRAYLGVAHGVWTYECWLVLRHVFVTALCAPLVFWVARHLDMILSTSLREQDALKQGFHP